PPDDFAACQRAIGPLGNSEVLRPLESSRQPPSAPVPIRRRRNAGRTKSRRDWRKQRQARTIGLADEPSTVAARTWPRRPTAPGVLVAGPPVVGACPASSRSGPDAELKHCALLAARVTIGSPQPHRAYFGADRHLADGSCAKGI